MLDKVIQILFKLAFWKVLWKNAAVASDFPAQTIAMNELSDYKFVAIETSTVSNNTVSADTQANRKIDIFKTGTEETGALIYGGFIMRPTAESRGVNGYRTFTINNNNITFKGGTKTLFNNSTDSDNTLCCPVRIYGFLHK